MNGKPDPSDLSLTAGCPVGYGAVQRLRVVFAEVHAPTIRETVSFHGARSQFNDTGQPVDPTRVNAAADKMLGQLVWWAEAAKAQRDRVAYPG